MGVCLSIQQQCIHDFGGHTYTVYLGYCYFILMTSYKPPMADNSTAKDAATLALLKTS